MDKAERARRYAINWEAENFKKAEKIRKLEAALNDANDVLRSTYQIADRNGVDTNWPSFKEQVKRVLNQQHAIMYPKT